MKITRKTVAGSAILLLMFTILSISTPGLPGFIIYRSIRDGNLDLYLINVNGGFPRRLTDNPENNEDPAYIAATDQIGFVSPVMGNMRFNVHLMGRDGEGLKQIAYNPEMEIQSPDWSADGKYIAVSAMHVRADCDQDGCRSNIYVIDTTDMNFTNLTESSANEWGPDWSPDGKKIVFYSDRDGDLDIYVMNRDGSNLVQLTNNLGYDGRPRWSPDGKMISFESDRDGTGWHVYVMNADGSDLRQITSGAGDDYFASWSPDGRWLVYLSDESRDNGIFVVDIESKERRHVLDYTFQEKKFDYSPIWIP